MKSQHVPFELNSVNASCDALCRGVVSKSDERGVKVSLSSSVDGFLPWKFVEESSGDARALFKRGMGVRVQVFHVDEAEHRVVLTRKGVSGHHDGQKPHDLSRGSDEVMWMNVVPGTAQVLTG